MAIPTKPTTARKTTNSLYSSTSFYAPLCEGSGLPASLVSGAAGSWVADGGVAIPAWAVDATVGGASLLFEDGTSSSSVNPTDEELLFAGEGLNATTCVSGVSFFAIYRPTGISPAAAITFAGTGASTDLGFIFDSSPRVRCYIGGTPFTPGFVLSQNHTYLLLGTFDANSNSTLRVYDFTTATDVGLVTGTENVSITAFVTGGTGDVTINWRNGSNWCMRGRLGNVGMHPGTPWGTTEYNQLIADPWCYGRGTLVLSPSSTSAGTSPVAIGLTSNLITPYTAGSPGSPTFTKADSGGASSTISSQSVATTTTGTLNLIPGTSAGTVTIGDTFASAPLTVSASGATTVTLTGTPTGNAHSASTNMTASVNGTMSSTGVYTVASSVAGDTFSPSTINLTTGTQSVNFSCTAFTASVARNITLTYVSGPVLTNAGSISYTPGLASLTCGAISQTSVSATSLGYSVAAPTGGSGAYGPLKVYVSTTSNFTPGGGNLNQTISSPTFPQAVAITSLTASTGYFIVFEIDDASSHTGLSAQQQAATYPIVSTGVGAIGQSHTGFVPSLGTNVTGSITDIYPGFTFVNEGVSSSFTTQWLPGTSNYNGAKAAFISAFVGLNRAVIIYEFGVNDANNNVSPATFASQLTTIMSTMSSDVIGGVSGLTSVISLISGPIPPAPLLGGLTNATIATMQSYITQMKLLHNGTSILYMGDDVFLFCLENQTSKYYTNDGVHLTNTGTPGPGAAQTGYQIVGQLWAQGVHRALSGFNIPGGGGGGSGGTNNLVSGGLIR